MSESRARQPEAAHALKIAHVTCPRCDYLKAVVAATTYNELLCFCPTCEHVWDCAKPTPPRASEV